jgi:hypothetical protein
MCDLKREPGQQLDLIVPDQYITQVKLEVLDQFHLVPANLVTPEDETGTLSSVYCLDELTKPKWWQLLRYVRQKKFEHVILRVAFDQPETACMP